MSPLLVPLKNQAVDQGGGISNFIVLSGDCLRDKDCLEVICTLIMHPKASKTGQGPMAKPEGSVKIGCLRVHYQSTNHRNRAVFIPISTENNFTEAKRGHNRVLSSSTTTRAFVYLFCDWLIGGTLSKNRAGKKKF